MAKTVLTLRAKQLATHREILQSLEKDVNDNISTYVAKLQKLFMELNEG